MTNVDPGTGRSPYAARKHDHHNPLAGGKVVPSKALSAAGEPSSETFLRGDDTWAEIPAAPVVAATPAPDPAMVNVAIVSQDNVDLFANAGAFVTADWNTSTFDPGAATWVDSVTSTHVNLAWGMYALNFQVFFIPDSHGFLGEYGFSPGNTPWSIQDSFGAIQAGGDFTRVWQRCYVAQVGPVSLANIERISFAPYSRWDGSAFVSGDLFSMRDGQASLSIVKIA